MDGREPALVDRGAGVGVGPGLDDVLGQGGGVHRAGGNGEGLRHRGVAAPLGGLGGHVGPGGRAVVEDVAGLMGVPAEFEQQGEGRALHAVGLHVGAGSVQDLAQHVLPEAVRDQGQLQVALVAPVGAAGVVVAVVGPEGIRAALGRQGKVHRAGDGHGGVVGGHAGGGVDGGHRVVHVFQAEFDLVGSAHVIITSVSKSTSLSCSS